ncbi:hypothetical protein BCR37DRAFT_388560 [Protomyces lactucae-debilis]|uniref:Uncharacterized protein n=1 Tax=Protomyces lactucae-debilis TaxID=2754530 RepID=A0A1Y2F6P4_PROLT|nr:uncharacterized protein BCR37DRAFT_388560 [Protomyces lactucae-debilis]ORY79568.1 hypothetical protein BCR37DRAFT_388560 [Protomyces lactucae-debilis]
MHIGLQSAVQSTMLLLLQVLTAYIATYSDVYACLAWLPVLIESLFLVDYEKSCSLCQAWHSSSSTRMLPAQNQYPRPPSSFLDPSCSLLPPPSPAHTLSTSSTTTELAEGYVRIALGNVQVQPLSPWRLRIILEGIRAIVASIKADQVDYINTSIRITLLPLVAGSASNCPPLSTLLGFASVDADLDSTTNVSMTDGTEASLGLKLSKSPVEAALKTSRTTTASYTPDAQLRAVILPHRATWILPCTLPRHKYEVGIDSLTVDWLGGKQGPIDGFALRIDQVVAKNRLLSSFETKLHSLELHLIYRETALQDTVVVDADHQQSTADDQEPRRSVENFLLYSNVNQRKQKIGPWAQALDVQATSTLSKVAWYPTVHQVKDPALMQLSLRNRGICVILGLWRGFTKLCKGIKDKIRRILRGAAYGRIAVGQRNHTNQTQEDREQGILMQGLQYL